MNSGRFNPSSGSNSDNVHLAKICAESRARLKDISNEQGIDLTAIQQPLLTSELRDFALALALCPDDASTGRAARRYAPAVAGFLFATRKLSGPGLSAACKFDAQNDKTICPYFYIAQYVLSLIDGIDNFYRDEVDEDGDLRDSPE